MPERIAVIGAGVIGLSTALQVQQALPGAVVTVIADQFLQDTTSDGAAGMFRPSAGQGVSGDLKLLRQWYLDSWEHLSAIARSADSKKAGVFFVSGYHLFSSKPGPIYETFSDIFPNFREMTDRDFLVFPEPRYPYGYFMTTLMAEPRYYMPYLTKQFKALGGRFQTKTVDRMEDLVGHYDLVVNCAGLRSRELVGDTRVHPNKGQMLRVEMPWQRHFVYVDSDTWIAPGMNSTTVGGTRESNKWDKELYQQDIDAIYERAEKVLPTVKKAKVLWKWAGLRPYRDQIRVEAETMHFGNKQLQVVHNYGHGGHGVALSWGTAKHATRLVVKTLAQSRKAKL